MSGFEDKTPDFTDAVLGRLDDRRFFKSARARRMLALGRAGLGVGAGLVLLTTVFVQAAEWSKPWQPERQTVLGPIVRSTVVAAGEGLRNATQQSTWVVDLAPITSSAAAEAMNLVPAPVQRVGQHGAVSGQHSGRGANAWEPAVRAVASLPQPTATRSLLLQTVTPGWSMVAVGDGAEPAFRFVRVLRSVGPTTAANAALKDQLGAVSDDFETLERSARSSPCSPR